jgi:sec-independent protein translocase protein TatA
MGSVSIWHWIVVGIVIMLMFGRGKVSDLMADVAKGIKSFKKGMAEDDTPQPAPAASPQPAPAPIADHVQANTEHASQASTSPQAHAAPAQPVTDHKPGV